MTDPSLEPKPSGCGTKSYAWLCLPVGIALGGLAGFLTGNFMVWLVGGLGVGLAAHLFAKGGT
ncbi:MAG: hypothetical protein HY735_28820 [Verrucomicrobia bacterium]|nr:hypothetical protein [Verrucomicrobiota bacterium]